MTRRALPAFVLATLLVVFSLATFSIPQTFGEAKSWTVDDDGVADFSRIQDALDAASSGDTILVKSGTYYETPKISKNVSLVAESLEAKIVGSEATGTVVIMEAGNASIVGFTIKGGKTGIWVGAGTHFEPVNRVVTRNCVVGASDRGVYVYWSNGALVSENVFINNSYGLQTYNSNVTATGNLFENNTCAIYHNPYALNVTTGGISVFVGNTFANNTCGVYFDWRQAPTVLYHNNFVSNVVNVQFLTSAVSVKNVWDRGYPGGGNYWNSYTGTDGRSGKSQNESGSDGIGDTPYVLDQDNRDNYPLASPVSTLAFGESPTEMISVASNSTVTDFSYNADQRTISFNVSGSDQTTGFCRITIPNSIARDSWESSLNVLFDGQPWPFKKWTDPAVTCIYISYAHSLHNITFLGEPPAPADVFWIVVAGGVASFLVISSIVVLTRRRSSLPKNKQDLG